MADLGSADIAAMLLELEQLGGTVTVAFGTATTQGLLDQQAVEVLKEDMPGAINNEQGVHIKTGSLPSITSGSAITVDGVAFVVREPMPYGDGAMTRLALRNP